MRGTGMSDDGERNALARSSVVVAEQSRQEREAVLILSPYFHWRL